MEKLIITILHNTHSYSGQVPSNLRCCFQVGHHNENRQWLSFHERVRAVIERQLDGLPSLVVLAREHNWATGGR
jgi:hypothetical protein